ncbi:helix-turn-helix domain-containing protein [Microbacterium sp. A204]|uniref:helix-turn-helix domain-containing protein n=1 Tax=Microbacterium sp. A204 TaxID=3457321 RepID=UPI003FD59DCF
MYPQTAPEVEGLEERSITLYGSRDLAKIGVRGVSGELSMNARVRAFGAILVIGVSGSPSEIERRPIRPDLPTIDIIFVHQGEFEYLHSGVWVASSSPLIIASSGLPNRVRFVSDWRFVVARVPREQMVQFVPMLGDDARFFDELSVSERAMGAFLTQSVESEQPVSPGDSQTVDRMVLEMAGSVLRARQGTNPPSGSPRAAARDRAMATISADSSDPRLDPAGVARAVGMSLRHLQVIFAEAGTSIAGEIRRERARISRSILQDSRFDHLTIGDVSARAGFGSSDSMRRALEDIYRLTPRELRIGRA